MTDSDITGNIIADCGTTPQKQDMAEAHHAGCMCECCCLLSETNCEDTIDQCETAQTLGGTKKMKSKVTPILANCALLLAVIGFSSAITNAGIIQHHAKINIDPAVQSQVGDILAVETIQTDSISIDQDLPKGARVDRIDVADGSDITITSSTNLIGDHIINALPNDDIDQTIEN